MPDDTDWVGKGPTPEEKAAGREPRDDGPDMEAWRERIMSRDWAQPAVARLGRDTDDELERRRRRKGKTR